MKVLQALSTSVGTKIVIAVTGLSLVGFLVLHLAGNLLILSGPDQFNHYSHALISNPLVIPAELGLAGLFLLHVYKALRNLFTNQKARPERYAKHVWAGGPSRKTWASTSMALSGITVFVFLGLHLVTFKFGPYYAATDAGVRDLYRLTVEVFQAPGYVLFYVIAMAIVGLHLRHGISSAFQSLGLASPGWTKAVLAGGLALAVLIAGGFALIPIWVFFAR